MCMFARNTFLYFAMNDMLAPGPNSMLRLGGIILFSSGAVRFVRYAESESFSSLAR